MLTRKQASLSALKILYAISETEFTTAFLEQHNVANFN